MRYLKHSTSVLMFRGDDSTIGYSARRTSLGPEQALVEAFLSNGLDGLGLSCPSTGLAVFIEPRLESGFPDIVLARFKPDFFSRWRESRNSLTCAELKLLSFLHSVKGADSDRIHAQLRLSSSEILQSTELLLDAGLISRDSDKRVWMPKPLDETFGLDCLVAVEAKVCNSQVVLDQAALNRWFSSESYALTSVAPTGAFSREARRAGVGVVSADARRGYRRVVSPRRLSLPTSYASWQFNEWVGRRFSREGV